jgi:hypothetical protein
VPKVGVYGKKFIVYNNIIISMIYMAEYHPKVGVYG